MKTNFPPNPVDVINELSGILGTVRPELLESIDFALRHFEQHRQEVDGALHAHLARHQLCRRLDLKPLNELGFERRNVIGSGVHLVSAGYQIRVLKAGHDIDPESGQILRIMPVPTSHSRREYYDQRPLISSLMIDAPLRLLLLWDVSVAYEVADLELVCPRYGGRTRDSLEYYWRVPVPVDAAPRDITNILSTDPTPLPDIDIRHRESDATGTDDVDDSR